MDLRCSSVVQGPLINTEFLVVISLFDISGLLWGNLDSVIAVTKLCPELIAL